MSNLKIQIDSSSLSKNNNMITGVIYFDLNGNFFPEKTWNDFVIVLINNWVISSHNIISNITKSEEFYFMDGPFSLKITKNSTNNCIVEFNENNTTSVINFKITIEDFFCNILHNIIFLSNYCKQKGWETEDIKKLNHLKDKYSTFYNESCLGITEIKYDK